MFLLDSSIVFVSKKGSIFLRPEPNANHTSYTGGVVGSFTNNKVIFQKQNINQKTIKDDLINLKKTTNDYIEKYLNDLNGKKVFSFGINFLFINLDKDFESFSQNFMKGTNSFPKINDKNPLVANIRLQYPYESRKTLNISIQSTEVNIDDNGNQQRKSVPIIDANIDCTVTNFQVDKQSISDLENFYKNTEEKLRDFK